MAIEKIESIWQQKEMTFITNKTLLVFDGYLYGNKGKQYENNYSRSLKILGW